MATFINGLPIPDRKPSQAVNDASGGGESVLGSIWDFGKNVFTQVATIELQKYEAERMADLRAAEASANIARQNELSEKSYSTQDKAIIGTSSILAVVMLGAAAILIARR